MPDDSNWLFADRVPEALKQHAHVVRISGQLSKRKLLELLARELHFPAYFGHNWDALEECLGDLSWLPAGERLVLWHTVLPVARRADDRTTYLEILRSAIDKQRGGAHPLIAVFPPGTRGNIDSASS